MRTCWRQPLPRKSIKCGVTFIPTSTTLFSTMRFWAQCTLLSATGGQVGTLRANNSNNNFSMLAAPGVHGSVSKGGKKKWGRGKEKHKMFHEIESLYSHFTICTQKAEPQIYKETGSRRVSANHSFNHFLRIYPELCTMGQTQMS